MRIWRRSMRILSAIRVARIVLAIVLSASGCILSASFGPGSWIGSLAVPFALVTLLSAILLLIGVVCGRLGYLDET